MLVSELTHILKQRIVGWEYLPGHRFTEEEICREFGVSRSPVRETLRILEEHGLVHREILQQVPPRVDYSVTALGHSLEPIIRSLCDWGRKHAADLDDLASLSECRLPPAGRAAAA